MRVLLLTRDEHDRNGLVQALEAQGHGVIHAASGGEDLLTAIAHAGRLQAALLDQVALGNGWPRLLRQLRRRVPSLPVVVLLGPQEEQRWRLAILAGAFDALPESASEGAVLRVIYRALGYSTGRLIVDPLRSGVNVSQGAIRSVPSRDWQARPTTREYESAA
jgi:DNA-binding NtrC family response regulator